MIKEDLLPDLHEDLPLKERPLLSRESMKSLKISTISVCFIGLIRNTVFSHYYLHAARTLIDTIMQMATMNLAAIPALSFIFALPVSLLPMKKRRFTKKLLPVWCWTTITLTVLFSLTALLTQ